MSLRRSFLSRRFSSKFSSRDHPNSLGGILPLSASEFDHDASALSVGSAGLSSWSSMLPELLREIIQRVEASEHGWPNRQNVVSCACVCKRWRDITKEVSRATPHSGKITFPSCLKQPGPSDLPHQCLIKRNKKTSTFFLYLALTPCLVKVRSVSCSLNKDSLRLAWATKEAGLCLTSVRVDDNQIGLVAFTDKGKFLLAARRYRHGAHTEYIISLDAEDLSQGSNAYVGKLSSDFLGTNFTIYDSQPPHNGAKPSSSKSSRRFASKQISPQVSAGNFEVGQVSYKFNLLKSRGPRRMICSLKCPVSEDNGTNKPCENSKMKNSESLSSSSGLTILRNKAPRWHEHLQCWCLNFHGRVTVASVKNFQLVATVDHSQPGGKGDEETVLLQFGKVGDDTFTMDYRQPLSAFQAFAICLTSFGTKLACE